MEKARSLAKRIDLLAADLVSPIEVNRARTLLARLSQTAAKARGQWGVASAELTRTLRLDPSAIVGPVEPPNLQVTILSPQADVDELIPIGLVNRPELASQQALVRAALTQLKQERLRPLMPSVLLSGNAAPAAPGGYLMGGLFASSNNGNSAPLTGRNDVNLQLLWSVNNLGFGNRATVREREAEKQQRMYDLFKMQDTVAAEVAKAHAELTAASTCIAEAETGVREAQVSYAGNIKGLSETTRFGDLLVLVNRPQEVVAALEQLANAYDNYFTAINDYNRTQFRLFRALGYPPTHLICDGRLGNPQPAANESSH